MKTPMTLGAMLIAVTLVLALPGSSSAERERDLPWAVANEPGTAFHMVHSSDLQDPDYLDSLSEQRLVVCSASIDVEAMHELLPDTIPFVAVVFMLVPDWGHGNPFWDGWRDMLLESDYYHDAKGNRIRSVWNAYWIRTNPDYAYRIANYFADNLQQWDGLYIDMFNLQWDWWHIDYLLEHGAVEPIDQDLHRDALLTFGLTLRSRIGDQWMIVNTSGFPGDYVNGITMEHPAERFGLEYTLQQYRDTLNGCAYRGRPCFNVSWYEDLGVPRLVMPGTVAGPPAD